MAGTETEPESSSTKTELEPRKGRNLTESKRNYSSGRDQGCSGTGSMAGTEIVEYGPGTEPR